MAGRPTRYRPEYGRMAKKACELGATDEDLAILFGVKKQTINNWKKRYPEQFFAPIKEGKSEIDDQVEQALLSKALGGVKTKEKKLKVNPDGSQEKTVTEKESQPETMACIYWLNNRRPGKWRQRPDVDMDEEAPPVKWTFEVAPAVKEIKVTNAKT